MFRQLSFLSTTEYFGAFDDGGLEPTKLFERDPHANVPPAVADGVTKDLDRRPAAIADSLEVTPDFEPRPRCRPTD